MGTRDLNMLDLSSGLIEYHDGSIPVGMKGKRMCVVEQ